MCSPAQEALAVVMLNQGLGYVDRTPQLHCHQRSHAEVVLPGTNTKGQKPDAS